MATIGLHYNDQITPVRFDGGSHHVVQESGREFYSWSLNAYAETSELRDVIGDSVTLYLTKEQAERLVFALYAATARLVEHINASDEIEAGK